MNPVNSIVLSAGHTGYNSITSSWGKCWKPFLKWNTKLFKSNRTNYNEIKDVKITLFRLKTLSESSSEIEKRYYIIKEYTETNWSNSSQSNLKTK